MRYSQIYVVVLTTSSRWVFINHLVFDMTWQRKYRRLHSRLIRYASDVKTYRGNVREKENNYHPGKWCPFFLIKLIVKEVFYHLLLPMPSWLPTNVWGYFPHITRLRVWFQHLLERNIMTQETKTAQPAAGISGGEVDAKTTWGYKNMRESSSSNRGLGRGIAGHGGRGGHQVCGIWGGCFNRPAYTSSIRNFRGEVDDYGTVLGTTDKQR